MKKEKILNINPADVGFIYDGENYENILKTIKDCIEQITFLKKKSKSLGKSLSKGLFKKEEDISAKEFLDVINNFNSYDKEIYITPSDERFKTLIEEIQKLKASPKQKASILFYSIIKHKLFEYQNTKIAIICFIYFLAEYNIKDIRRYDNEYEKKILFLISLIIEKSSIFEKNEILKLIERMI